MSKTVKCRAVTFSFKLNQYNLDELFTKCNSSKFAYIVHDSDLDDFMERKDTHIHFYYRVDTPRTLAWFSDYLSVPQNQLQAVKSDKAVLRYLCHLDSPEKAQYDVHKVVANFDYEKAIQDKDKIDYYQLYDDYLKVGEYMSVSEFVQKYNYIMPKQLSSILTVFSKLEERGRQTIFENQSKDL